MPVANPADVNTRVRIADPAPPYCSACHKGASAEVRFVDFQAALDSGVFVNEDGATLVGCDDLFLCEGCVREAAEAVGFKPQAMAALYAELKQKDELVERQARYIRSLNEALASQQDVLDHKQQSRPPGRPRKA
jgi:hypothetical protein